MVRQHIVLLKKTYSRRYELQIYSFLFTAWPFWYLGEDEVFVFQMIGFVERLPAEWESKWESMRMKSSHNLETEEGK